MYLLLLFVPFFFIKISDLYLTLLFCIINKYLSRDFILDWINMSLVFLYIIYKFLSIFLYN